ncbi:MAG: hypothetical protein H7834_01330 [Magnetococcus sp. YQC-9]
MAPRKIYDTPSMRVMAYRKRRQEGMKRLEIWLSDEELAQLDRIVETTASSRARVVAHLLNILPPGEVESLVAEAKPLALTTSPLSDVLPDHDGGLPLATELPPLAKPQPIPVARHLPDVSSTLTVSDILHAAENVQEPTPSQSSTPFAEFTRTQRSVSLTSPARLFGSQPTPPPEPVVQPLPPPPQKSRHAIWSVPVTQEAPTVSDASTSAQPSAETPSKQRVKQGQAVFLASLKNLHDNR